MVNIIHTKREFLNVRQLARLPFCTVDILQGITFEKKQKKNPFDFYPLVNYIQAVYNFEVFGWWWDEGVPLQTCKG